MRISTKGRYSLRAMLDVAYYGNKRPVRLKELAERTEISRNYLVQLFQQLKKAELVRSIRGPTGGFILMRPPRQITVKDVLQAVSESFIPVACLENDGRDVDCNLMDDCIMRDFWMDFKVRVESFLEETTLEELYGKKVKRTNKLQGRESARFN